MTARGCNGRRAGGQAEALEDGAGGVRGMDLSDDAHPRLAAGAFEHVDVEHAAHQLGPGIARCGCGRALRAAWLWLGRSCSGRGLLHRSHVLNVKGRSYRLRELEQAAGART